MNLKMSVCFVTLQKVLKFSKLKIFSWLGKQLGWLLSPFFIQENVLFYCLIYERRRDEDSYCYVYVLI